MKKIALCSAVVLASSVASVAQAAVYNISSNVTDNEVMLGISSNLPGPNPTDLSISGWVDITLDGVGGYTINSGEITWDGSITFNPTPSNQTTVFFNNSTNAWADGVLFDGSTTGSISYSTDGGAETVLDLAASPASALVGGGNAFGIPQAGLQLLGGTINGDGSITVGLCGTADAVGFADTTPGVCDGTYVGDNVMNVTVLGNAANVYLAGDITLTEASAVPVPAAAWLFGSALLGLAGIGRKRKGA